MQGALFSADPDLLISFDVEIAFALGDDGYRTSEIDLILASRTTAPGWIPFADRTLPGSFQLIALCKNKSALLARSGYDDQALPRGSHRPLNVFEMTGHLPLRDTYRGRQVAGRARPVPQCGNDLPAHGIVHRGRSIRAFILVLHHILLKTVYRKPGRM